MLSFWKNVFWPCAVLLLLVALVLFALIVLPTSTPSHVITNVAASGPWLAAGTRSGQVALCRQTQIGSCKTIAVASGELNDLQFSPDERFLAIAGNTIQFVALHHPNESFPLRANGRHYGTIRFDHRGTTLLTSNDQSQIEVIDIHSRAVITRICCSSFYGGVSFSKNDTQIINAGHWPRVWTTAGQIAKQLTKDRQYPPFRPRPIAVDAKAHAVFMGSQDGRVCFWNLRDFSLLRLSDGKLETWDLRASPILRSSRLVQ